MDVDAGGSTDASDDATEFDGSGAPDSAVWPDVSEVSDAVVSTAQPGCSDLFRQDVFQTYSIEISADELKSMTDEFNNLAAVMSGVDFAVYHPIILKVGDETIADARIKLRGQSSWLQTVMFDAERAKMQFKISFNEVNPNGKFHGLTKLVFDMPRSDWTFLNGRIAHVWLRDVGIMAPCSASAKLMINGSLYGVYVVEENVGDRVIKQFFPDHPDGDLWKGGIDPATDKPKPNFTKQAAFWSASSITAVEALVDVEGSVKSWAAEAVLNNADGYYGGIHNFYLYDQGDKGFIFLPRDTDSMISWLPIFEWRAGDSHPFYWWEKRAQPGPKPGPHWRIVMSDPKWRARYVEHIDGLLKKWDVDKIQSWIDAWSQQIAAAVVADPHRWVTDQKYQMAIATARSVIASRALYLSAFVQCERTGTGKDEDSDGVRWCEDCRDDIATIRPGLAETCGNAIDENCNGVADEGCP
jgi:hypothetical protein